MKQAPITLCGVTIKPGERKYIDLPLASLYTHAQVSMPVYVLHGHQPGPRLFVSAAVHGDEINGVEIIRRLLRSKSLKNLKGTLIAIPVVNVYGFINKSRYLPDRRDLNRSFPGHKSGSLAAQLAHLFMTEIVSHCTHGIDLHTAAIGRSNLPQIRTNLHSSSNAELKAMAMAFNSPVVLHSNLLDGSLRKVAEEEYGVKVILYEAGEALRFDEIPIRAGLRGVIAIMRHLGMLAPSRKKHPSYKPAYCQSNKWVRAPQSGILRVVKAMGQTVQNGDVLGYIANPFGTSEEAVLANCSGIIIGRTTLPLVHEGEALFNIAQTRDEEGAMLTLQSFQDEIDPAMENPFQ